LKKGDGTDRARGKTATAAGTGLGVELRLGIAARAQLKPDRVCVAVILADAA